MTDKQKASQVLQYMEDELDGKAIINLLNPYLNDEQLAALYDRFVSDGTFHEDGYCDTPDDDTPAEMAIALAYVREQLEADELTEIKAQIDRSYRYHMAASDCVTLTDKVIDLLEEFGDDNDLPEGWWEDYGDIDDWLLKL